MTRKEEDGAEGEVRIVVIDVSPAEVQISTLEVLRD